MVYIATDSIKIFIKNNKGCVMALSSKGMSKGMRNAWQVTRWTGIGLVKTTKYSLKLRWVIEKICKACKK
jgi:hypothetical protein